MIRRKRIYALRCRQIVCKNCPLKTKLCQTFIHDGEVTIGSIIEQMHEKKKLTELEYRNVKEKSQQLYDGTIREGKKKMTSSNDKLIRDEVKMLNSSSRNLPAYAFSKEQADQIVKKCKYRVKVETDGEVYIITKVGGKYE